jgi:hypothetical protein
MKIRAGFVSNSSSSSFILKPNSIKILNQKLNNEDFKNSLIEDFKNYVWKEDNIDEEIKNIEERYFSNLEKLKNILEKNDPINISWQLGEIFNFDISFYNPYRVKSNGWNGDFTFLDNYENSYKEIRNKIYCGINKYVENKKDILIDFLYFVRGCEFQDFKPYSKKFEYIYKACEIQVNNFYKETIMILFLGLLRISPLYVLKDFKRKHARGYNYDIYIDLFDIDLFDWWIIHNKDNVPDEVMKFYDELNLIFNKEMDEFLKFKLYDFLQEHKKGYCVEIGDGGGGGDIVEPLLERGIGIEDIILIKSSNH